MKYLLLILLRNKYVLSFLIIIYDIFLFISNIFSILFTVKTDVLNKSFDKVKINNRFSIYDFFIVIESNSEYERRLISWFYRNHKEPDITDFINFQNEFNLKTIPYHKLLLFRKDKIKDVFEFISIKDKEIIYILNDMLYTYCIKYGSILPDKIINN